MGHPFGEAVPLDTGGGQSCAHCPAGPAPEMASMLSLQEENQLLQQELSRVEDLLAQSRAERDELAIKYSAASERVGAAGRRAQGSPALGVGVCVEKDSLSNGNKRLGLSGRDRERAINEIVEMY